MSRHDPLQDMLDYAQKAVRFCEHKTRSDLDRDEVLQLVQVAHPRAQRLLLSQRFS